MLPRKLFHSLLDHGLGSSKGGRQVPVEWEALPPMIAEVDLKSENQAELGGEVHAPGGVEHPTVLAKAQVPLESSHVQGEPGAP